MRKVLVADDEAHATRLAKQYLSYFQGAVDFGGGWLYADNVTGSSQTTGSAGIYADGFSYFHVSNSRLTSYNDSAAVLCAGGEMTISNTILMSGGTSRSGETNAVIYVHPNGNNPRRLSGGYFTDCTFIGDGDVFDVDGKSVAVLLRGDREVNDVKLKNLLDATNVDMATLKAEWQYQHHRTHGVPLRSRAFAHISRLNGLAGMLAGQLQVTLVVLESRGALVLAEPRQRHPVGVVIAPHEVGLGEGRLQLDGVCELALRFGEQVHVDRPRVRFHERLEAFLVSNEGLDVAQAGIDHGLALDLVHHHAKRAGDVVGNLGLDLEDVVQLPVVGLRPQVIPVAGPDQLRSDTSAAAGAPDAAFEHVSDVE
mgnify:CR=1 FL=1